MKSLFSSIHLRFARFALLLIISLMGTVVVYAQDNVVNGFVVTYGGRIYDSATNQTTFTYSVSGTNVPPDLSHFDIEIPTCPSPLAAVAYSPTDAVSFGVDPTTGVNGIKWDLPLLMSESRTYSITFQGNVLEGNVTVAVKGGNGFKTLVVLGPACTTPSLDLEKYVSIDGVTWQDADTAPGPNAPLGTQVRFRFVVTNAGNAELTNITLTDSVFDLSSCALPSALPAGAFFECAIGPFDVVQGQHINIGTVTGQLNGVSIIDADAANYFGGDRPSIDVEKFVSKDGGATWDDADGTPGILVKTSETVSFRFVVTNDGTAPLSNITLTDNTLDLSSCAIPATLEAGASFECVVGPLPSVTTQHTNIATATGGYNGTIVTDTDNANYRGGADTNLPVTIVIEGPVQQINVNIITIYNINIQLAPDDPNLNIIQVGDIVRVEGDTSDMNGTIIIVAINITIINVDIDVGTGDYWRDEGNCANPPPPWAPAHGWRRRCENSNINIDIYIGNDSSGSGSGSGSGRGMGMGRGN